MEEGKLPTGAQDQLGAGDWSAGHPCPSLGTLSPRHTAAFSLHCLWGTDADGSQAIHPGFEKWQILGPLPQNTGEDNPHSHTVAGNTAWDGHAHESWNPPSALALAVLRSLPGLTDPFSLHGTGRGEGSARGQLGGVCPGIHIQAYPGVQESCALPCPPVGTQKGWTPREGWLGGRDFRSVQIRPLSLL